jgi:hypothetical protein
LHRLGETDIFFHVPHVAFKGRFFLQKGALHFQLTHLSVSSAPKIGPGIARGGVF